MLHHEDSTLSGRVTPDPTKTDASAVSRFGVNSAKHPEALAAGFFDVERMPTAMALLYAENIFKYDYFMHFAGYQIADQDVANKFSDLAFNCGTAEATTIVQRAINAIKGVAGSGVKPEDLGGLKEDGKPGSLTIAAMNAVDPGELLAAMRSKAVEFYEELADEKPQLKVDLQGWLTRAES